MNPNNPKHRERLSKSVTYCRNDLAVYRKNRKIVLKEYVGTHYSDDGAEKEVVLNLIGLFIDTMARFLAAQAPRALFKTAHAAVKQGAKRAELRTNTRAKEQHLERFFQKAARHALVSMAIGKVGIASGRNVEIGNTIYDVGNAFAGIVDLDDWVHDTLSDQWEEQQFRGNLYYPRIDVLEDNNTFTPEIIEKLRLRSQDRTSTLEDGEDRAETIAHGDREYHNEFAPRACLWDIYLPYEGLLCTFAANPQSGDVIDDDEPLSVREWDGPDEGPYLPLFFRDVVGNAMPLPPVAHLLPLHNIVNSCLRKIGDDVERHKRVGIVAPKGKQTAEDVKRAYNGKIIVGDPNAVTEVEFGGPNSLSMAFAVWGKNLFTRDATGGLELLGGMAAGAETLGQEQMLFGTASRQVQEMQDRMLAFASQVMRHMAWWDWTNPVDNFEVPYQAEGSDEEVLIRITPQERAKIDLLNLNIEILPYSMQYTTPSERVQKLLQIWSNVILPALPFFQSQGQVPDARRILSDLSEYTDLPELQEWMTSIAPGGAGTEPPMERPTQSPHTVRENVRRNVSGGRGRGFEEQLMTRLLGGGEGQNAAAIGA